MIILSCPAQVCSGRTGSALTYRDYVCTAPQTDRVFSFTGQRSRSLCVSPESVFRPVSLGQVRLADLAESRGGSLVPSSFLSLQMRSQETDSNLNYSVPFKFKSTLMRLLPFYAPKSLFVPVWHSNVISKVILQVRC